MATVGTIREFKTLKGYWVLYWIGRIKPIPDFSEYMVELIFVKLANGLQDYDNFPSIASNRENTKYIQISISFAPGLAIGSVIKDGQFYKEPSLLNEKVHIEINRPANLHPQTFLEICRGKEINGYPNIHRYYNYSILATRDNSSFPLGIDAVIFPCFEIGRKYFFKSDALSKKVFDGEIGDREIFYYKHPDGQTIIPESTSEMTYVLLTKDMYDSDAKHIARIKHNERARLSALQVFSSIYGETDEKKKTVSTFFPFEQKAKLKVVGKKYGLGDRSIFLVYQIESCDAPFFPGILRFNRVNDGRVEKDGDFADAIEQNGVKIINNNTKDENFSELTSEEKPNYQSAKELFQFELVDTFDSDPEVIKEEKQKQKTFSTESPIVTNHNIETYSTNSATSNDHKTSKAGVETESTEEAFKNFIEALTILKHDGYILHYLYPTAQGGTATPKYFHFPQDNLDEHSKRWCYLKKNNVNKPDVLRACMVAELVHDEQYYYLLEIQPKYPTESFYTFLINDESGNRIQEAEMLTVLNEIALRQGKIKGKNFELISRIGCKRIEHTTITVGTQKTRNPKYLMNALKRIL